MTSQKESSLLKSKYWLANKNKRGTEMKKLTGTVLVALSLLFMGSTGFAYTVQPGDTLSEIALSNNMSMSEIMELNPEISNPHLIFIGENINTIGNNPVVNEVQSSVQVNSTVSAAESELLARLVRAEAKGESYSGKVAVAEVVLNRVQSPLFPNTIEGVIYQSGQFSPVSNGAIYTPADAESIQAVNEALSGSNLTNGALYFYNPRIVRSSWFESKPTLAVIGNHTFKR